MIDELIDKFAPEEEWSDLINYAFGEPMLAISRDGLKDFAQAVRAAVIEECAAMVLTMANTIPMSAEQRVLFKMVDHIRDLK